MPGIIPSARRFHIGPVTAIAAAVFLTTAACGAGSSGAASTPSSLVSATPSDSPTGKTHKGIAGQVTAISSTSVTVVTKNGSSVTLALDASTKYGTKNQPIKPSGIKVGDRVVLTPNANGTAAKRIALPKRLQSTSPTPTPS